MKYLHPWMSSAVLLGSILLSSCAGSYRDPLDGQQKKWECGDDPTPEEARTKHKALEEHKGSIDTLLAVLRRGTTTETSEANIDLCLENLAQIADAKEKLAPRLR